MPYRHTTAMLNEAVELLACRPGMIIVDCTLGGCGHARAICEKIQPDGLLIGIDQDPDAISHARQVLRPFAAHVHLFHGNFIDLPDYLSQLQIAAVEGILLDLGLSLNQLEASGRGFSFKRDEPLDMRMDVRSKTTAADLVNGLDELGLERIFRQFGEERWARPIARRIVQTRQHEPITTSLQLAHIVAQAIPRKSAGRQKIHPATRVFMALRIAVNRELEILEAFLPTAVDLLRTAGRLCVLTFHSLEDRIIKQGFKALATTCTCPPELPRCICQTQPRVRVLTKKARRPSEQEVSMNPMARSTRLRAVEKL
jgi:16S rRNA (cytosine1402-N4)-methyltransferase